MCLKILSLLPICTPSYLIERDQFIGLLWILSFEVLKMVLLENMFYWVWRRSSIDQTRVEWSLSIGVYWLKWSCYSWKPREWCRQQISLMYKVKSLGERWESWKTSTSINLLEEVILPILMRNILFCRKYLKMLMNWVGMSKAIILKIRPLS